MRVLLVEDDPSTARSIELMLGHANFNVYVTDMGEEAVEVALDGFPQGVLGLDGAGATIRGALARCLRLGGR